MPLHEEMILTGNRLFRWRSYLPLLFLAIMIPAILDFTYLGGSEEYDYIWEAICLSISMLGFLIRCFTIGFTPKGTSGRNTKHQKAHELNTTGIYSVMRNPLYFGNFFIALGIIMFLHSLWVCMIFALIFCLYYERIILAEEDFLKENFGQEYIEWCRITPVFWPKFSNWKRPNLSFSLKNVLKREYTAFFAIIACFFILEFSTDYVVYRKIVLDKLWLAMLIAGFIVYITLRTIRKHTTLLNVEGR